MEEQNEKTYNYKVDSSSEDAPTAVELSDGQHVIIDGQEMVFEKGKFKLTEPENFGKGERHFYLYFRKAFTKDVEEICGCKVTKTHNYTIVDIYPIIEKLFGSSASIAGSQICGVESINGDNCVEQVQLMFSDRVQHQIKSKLERMFDMSVVNQNQRKGFQSYVEEMLCDFWQDFYSQM